MAVNDQIRALNAKAAESVDPNDAMKFAQAALNVAHTAQTVAHTAQTLEKGPDLQYLLQALYNSVINCGLQSFWDGGWTVWIGDDMNGKEEATFDNDRIWDIATWLRDRACKKFPESGFAKLMADLRAAYPLPSPHFHG